MHWGYAWGIIATTLLMRSMLMPITYYVQKNMHKMKILEPELRGYRENMMQQFQTGNRVQGLQVRNQMHAFMLKYGISNAVPLLNLLTIPVFISFFISLRYMVFTPELYLGLSSTNFLWFSDLSQPDPYYLLPLISALFNWGSITVSRKLNPLNASTPAFVKKFNKYLPYTPFLGAIFLSTFPAGLNLYWMMLSFSNMTFMYLFSNKYVTKYIGLPPFYPNTMKAAQYELKEGKSLKKAVLVDRNNDIDEMPNEKTVKVYTRRPPHDNRK